MAAHCDARPLRAQRTPASGVRREWTLVLRWKLHAFDLEQQLATADIGRQINDFGFSKLGREGMTQSIGNDLRLRRMADVSLQEGRSTAGTCECSQRAHVAHRFVELRSDVIVMNRCMPNDARGPGD